MTVSSLKERLDELAELGYGDMKIKCRDGYLRTDEIGFDLMNKEVVLRGNIYNFPPTQKVKRFNAEIREAYERYWKD